jgi:O-antigen ligase
MFLDRPILGYGSGAFAEQFRKREKTSDARAASASHTIPITVAAEQGIVGLASYLFVLLTALALVWQGLGRLRGPDPPPAELIARGAVAAAFTGLVVHTLAYAAFLEDPLTWTLLGAAIGLRFSSAAERRRPERGAAQAPAVASPAQSAHAAEPGQS